MNACRPTVSLLALLSLLASPCLARAAGDAPARTFRTSQGAVFEFVSHPRFGKAVKAPDGTVWSGFLDRKLSNSGTPAEGTMFDSEATRACDRLGGRLPSGDDFETLTSYFVRAFGDEAEQAKGQRELDRVFPGLARQTPWSSTVDPEDEDRALKYDGETHELTSTLRYADNAVLCIWRPEAAEPLGNLRPGISIRILRDVPIPPGMDQLFIQAGKPLGFRETGAGPTCFLNFEPSADRRVLKAGRTFTAKLVSEVKLPPGGKFGGFLRFDETVQSMTCCMFDGSHCQPTSESFTVGAARRTLGGLVELSVDAAPKEL